VTRLENRANKLAQRIIEKINEQLDAEELPSLLIAELLRKYNKPELATIVSLGWNWSPREAVID